MYPQEHWLLSRLCFLQCPLLRLPNTAHTLAEEEGGASTSAPKVLVYGGFSGEAVEGDILAIDSKV